EDDADTEFVFSEEVDDETTLDAEDALAGGDDVAAELAALQAEANLSIDELRKRSGLYNTGGDGGGGYSNSNFDEEEEEEEGFSSDDFLSDFDEDDGEG
ncbi:unnamed protein product, partial [Laminaria digitata]